MAADGSSKEEVPDWGKADMQKMKAKLSELEWEDEVRELGGGEAMDKLEQATGHCG